MLGKSEILCMEANSKTTPAWEPNIINGPMLNLIQRLSLGPYNPRLQIITFIAARPQEGTSTIAREYAQTLAAETSQKILLIDAGTQLRGHSMPGIVDNIMAGKPPHDAVRLVQGFSTAYWIGSEKNRSASGQVIHDADFWKALSVSFDTIIIDAPSLQSKFDGVGLAAKADAAVLVIEAEETPEPVIKNLRDTLTGAGANIAGLVMNKRRYHIPHKVYARL